MQKCTLGCGGPTTLARSCIALRGQAPAAAGKDSSPYVLIENDCQLEDAFQKPPHALLPQRGSGLTILQCLLPRNEHMPRGGAFVHNAVEFETFAPGL